MVYIPNQQPEPDPFKMDKITKVVKVLLTKLYPHDQVGIKLMLIYLGNVITLPTMLDL